MKRFSRREMLINGGRGLGAAALTALLGKDGFFPQAFAQQAAGSSVLNAVSKNPLAPKVPHFAPKAKSVIWLYMHGAPSTLDLYDYKPDLIRLAGKPVPESFGPIKTATDGGVGPIFASKRTWKQYGHSGAWVSDLLPGIAQHADDITFLKSVNTQGNTHIISMYRMNTGALINGRPSLGSWVLYGLGSANENLPAYVVLTDNSGGYGVNDGSGVAGGAANWGSGFLPAVYQGTAFRQGESPILHLNQPKLVGLEQERGTLDLLKSVNQHHAANYPGDDELEARLDSYELAFRMQTAAPEAVDLNQETEATKKLYGLDDELTRAYGTNLLQARRLVERGVRFVQVYSGKQSSWDAHNNIEKNHGLMAKITDKPIAGLLTDLKARGLLDQTLVIWGGEFGRTPYSQSGDGRDHNPWGFTQWMAGGGIKKGHTVGATDEIGLRATENPVETFDIHATILNQLGLNHMNLNYLNDGRRERPTVNGGKVITDAIA